MGWGLENTLYTDSDSVGQNKPNTEDGQTWNTQRMHPNAPSLSW